MKKVNDYHFSYREKDGGVQLILAYKVGKKWRQKTRQGFRTRREANAAKADLLKEAEKAAQVNAQLEKLTLRRFYHDFFLRDYCSDLQRSTERSYRAALAALGEIADKEMKKITYLDVAEKINVIRDAGYKPEYKPETVNLRIRQLKRFFDVAVSPFKIIPENPIAEMRYSKAPKHRRVRAFTREQLFDLLEKMKSRPRFRAMCAVAGLAGLRFGEVAALTWADVDFKNAEIHVTKQTENSTTFSARTKKLKTENSRRTVPLSPMLAQILQEYRAETPASIDRRLFPVNKSHAGSDLNKVIQRVYPGFTFHCLRHTFATLMLKSGADIQTVAALIGDTPAVVMKVYIHYTDDLRRDAEKLVKNTFSA